MSFERLKQPLGEYTNKNPPQSSNRVAIYGSATARDLIGYGDASSNSSSNGFPIHNDAGNLIGYCNPPSKPANAPAKQRKLYSHAGELIGYFTKRK